MEIDEILDLVLQPGMNAMTAICDEIVFLAKDFCPVDTGKLRDSIHSNVHRTETQIIGKVEVSADYAAYVEFGARPFLWPALRAVEAQIPEIFKKVWR